MRACRTLNRLNRRNFLGLFGLSASALALSRRAHGLADAAPDLTQDTNRPEYHFLAPRSWMNDPNGPVWFNGKYHIFYQWSPYSVTGGPPHWGHAVSTDMVHWHHLPIAIAPTPDTADRDGCWTGSAVVRDGVPTVIYTGVVHDDAAKGTDKEWRQAQMLATAEDDGLQHWKKLPGPVVPAPPEGMAVTGFRDPCPWREADGWYLIVGSGERDKGGCVLLYRSQDLRHWEYLHPLAHGARTGNPAPDSVDRGDMWECPDFFEVNGQHCLFFSSENKVSWATGDYDKETHRFTIKRTGLVDQGGIAYYAPKGFYAADGRRILWGWVRETRSQQAFAASGWAGAITLPRVLTIGQQASLKSIRPSKWRSSAARSSESRSSPARPSAKAHHPAPGTPHSHEPAHARRSHRASARRRIQGVGADRRCRRQCRPLRRRSFRSPACPGRGQHCASSSMAPSSSRSSEAAKPSPAASTASSPARLKSKSHSPGQRASRSPCGRSTPSPLTGSPRRLLQSDRSKSSGRSATSSAKETHS